ncbi:hypothetical protein [Companilactobacillus zhongbaensis]|uniref:hypothetical protein n=1 Tax=Companilactobacillus zhongbaensis TaxID=2486009 RepID=UPI000F7B745A|nr:hypothetical protein [Companilactobacillus zhongbaensis]
MIKPQEYRLKLTDEDIDDLYWLSKSEPYFHDGYIYGYLLPYTTGYALVGRPIELTEDYISPEFWLHILTLDGLEEVEDDE